MILTPFHPEIHRVHETPAVKALREHTGIENLITYLHAVHDRWILAIRSFDGRDLMELGPLDGQDGASTVPSKARFQELVRLLKYGWTPAEQRKEAMRQATGDAKKQSYENHLEALRRTDSAIHAMARHLKSRFGPIKAEKYLRSVGKEPTVRGL